MKVGVLGATGYAGQQLVWILNNHPSVEIEFVSSHSYVGERIEDIYEGYLEKLSLECISIQDAKQRFKEIEILFISLPHGLSFEVVEQAIKNNVKVIDLGADYRLDSSDDYEGWYKTKWLGDRKLYTPVYGLTEMNDEAIRNANLIANPGCYPTATLLALLPLLKKDIIWTNSIIVDAKSGVSGAGRGIKTSNLYSECNESIKAYGVTSHRHTPEIEQELSKVAKKDVKITFTPHLVPMNRGILSLTYSDLKVDMTEDEIFALYKKEYENNSFIRVKKNLPETRWVKGSNYCDISIRVDKRTNRVIVISAIDNLLKGAAGQAIQNMNLMMGLDEGIGIEMYPMFP